MNPDRWHQVDRLFEEVLDRPAAERPAFLDAACAGDTALRGEVERLLAADAQGSGFLEGPPEELLQLTLDDRQEAGSLGPYRLLRKIGSGGMGTVYLARREDEHYRRDVAVKVLRSGLASTEAFHRFIAERQILAHLEHPNIARLYDGGSTGDGRPYLVLERIDGLPLDRYCNRHRLAVDQRLALFRKICAAVQHAHQNLLVHRDLKPGNILVTPEGEPKLLDFGIAKRLAPEPGGSLRETRTGVRMMTPSYASPEQVRGEAITTASDVYSLGVILYELLAGRSPYRTSEAPHEIERAICEQAPERPGAALFRPEPPSPEEIANARKTRPAALGRRLQGDLDNIVLMALRKEPGRRYGSAAELSQDLDRHLQDLPVQARPDTLRYRSRKFVRRHRAAVLATAAIVLLTAGSVVSLSVQRRQLARERDKARYALSFLVDTFKKADPYQTKGEGLTAREILDQGTARVARELPGDPEAQAAVLDALGEVNLGLGRYDAAEPLLERSLALRRRIPGGPSLDVADSLEHLADLRNERSDRAGAEPLLREALAVRQRLQGRRSLAVAKTLGRLGATLTQKNVSPQTAPEIDAIFQEALDIAREAEGPGGLTVAETTVALSQLREVQGNYSDAERLLREAIAIERRLLGDQDPRVYREQSDLGAVLYYAGKPKEAEAVLRPCLARQRKILGREHPDVASTLNNLAMALQSQARYPESEALQREMLAIARAHYGPDHWRTALVLVNLGAAIDAQDRGREAIPYYEEALAIRRRTLGEEDPGVAQVLLLLAELYRNLDDPARGLALSRQALGIVEKAEGLDHPHVAFVLREIGRNYLDLGRLEEAEPVLRRSLEIRRAKLEAGHPDTVKSQVSLARCLILLGRLDEAALLLQEARTSLIAQHGRDSELVRIPEGLLAEIEKARADPKHP